MAAGGVALGVWTMWRALGVARGRREDLLFLVGVAAMLALIGLLLVFALAFLPDNEFGPCPGAP
jgi:hypothetical protein